MGVFFFFQAEDGIRDDLVTGVQTCALPISFDRGGQGQAGPRVPARRFDDGTAGPEEPLLLGDLEHLDGRPVLYRAARVQVLDLREEGGLYALFTFYSAHTDQGCVPDDLEHVLEIVHTN